MLFLQSARTHELEGACPRLRAGQAAGTGSNGGRGGSRHERRGGAVMRGGELQLSEDVGDVGFV